MVKMIKCFDAKHSRKLNNSGSAGRGELSRLPRTRPCEMRANSLFMPYIFFIFMLMTTFFAAPTEAAPPMMKIPDDFVHAPSEKGQKTVREKLGQSFRVLETDHFQVISDASPRYHRLIAGTLEQFYLLVHPRFFATEMKPVAVYLIHGGKDYERFMASRGFADVASRYGMYDPGTRTLYARRCFPDGRESGIGTLFHEAIHALIHADFPGQMDAPAWFNEGFASLFEQGRVLQGKWIYGNPNPRRETPFKEAFEAGRVPSLAAYLRLSDRDFSANDKIHYNMGRSFFLYLLLNHGESAISRFIGGLRRKQPPAESLTGATGMSLAELEKGWHKSLIDVNFGGDFLFRGSKSRSIDILKEGTTRYPAYGDLQATLSTEYFKIGDKEKAAFHAQAALRDPRSIYSQTAYSILSYSLWEKDTVAAKKALQAALGYQPWSEYVMEDEFNNLSRLEEAYGHHAEAARLRKELQALKAESFPATCGTAAPIR